MNSAPIQKSRALPYNKSSTSAQVLFATSQAQRLSTQSPSLIQPPTSIKILRKSKKYHKLLKINNIFLNK